MPQTSSYNFLVPLWAQFGFNSPSLPREEDLPAFEF